MTKILLVEDDKSLREIYGVRLLAEGYDIVSAGDGEEALAMAIKERPNLIISDVMMPKISGFDMLDILRSTTETRGIKVIMMTALSSEEQRARGVALGADKYLVKSQVGIEDVVKTVHDVLGDSNLTPEQRTANKAYPTAPAPAPTQNAGPAGANLSGANGVASSGNMISSNMAANPAGALRQNIAPVAASQPTQAAVNGAATASAGQNPTTPTSQPIATPMVAFSAGQQVSAGQNLAQQSAINTPIQPIAPNSQFSQNITATAQNPATTTSPISAPTQQVSQNPTQTPAATISQPQTAQPQVAQQPPMNTPQIPRGTAFEFIQNPNLQPAQQPQFAQTPIQAQQKINLQPNPAYFQDVVPRPRGASADQKSGGEKVISPLPNNNREQEKELSNHLEKMLSGLDFEV